MPIERKIIGLEQLLGRMIDLGQAERGYKGSFIIDNEMRLLPFTADSPGNPMFSGKITGDKPWQFDFNNSFPFAANAPNPQDLAEDDLPIFDIEKIRWIVQFSGGISELIASGPVVPTSAFLCAGVYNSSDNWEVEVSSADRRNVIQREISERGVIGNYWLDYNRMAIKERVATLKLNRNILFLHQNLDYSYRALVSLFGEMSGKLKSDLDVHITKGINYGPAEITDVVDTVSGSSAPQAFDKDLTTHYGFTSDRAFDVSINNTEGYTRYVVATVCSGLQYLYDQTWNKDIYNFTLTPPTDAVVSFSYHTGTTGFRIELRADKLYEILPYGVKPIDIEFRRSENALFSEASTVYSKGGISDTFSYSEGEVAEGPYYRWYIELNPTPEEHEWELMIELGRTGPMFLIIGPRLGWDYGYWGRFKVYLTNDREGYDWIQVVSAYRNLGSVGSGDINGNPKWGPGSAKHWLVLPTFDVSTGEEFKYIIYKVSIERRSGNYGYTDLIILKEFLV